MSSFPPFFFVFWVLEPTSFGVLSQPLVAFLVCCIGFRFGFCGVFQFCREDCCGLVFVVKLSILVFGIFLGFLLLRIVAATSEFE